MQLDKYDRAILEALQQDGRISNLDLAERVGLSPTPCARRVRRLEDSGLIERSVTLLNQSRLGLKLTAYIGISMDRHTPERFEQFEAEGYGHFPVCMAKTPYSFSADPGLQGAPSGFELPIREVRLSAGAGFVVVLCGDLFTMPGLPRAPAAERIFVNGDGQIEGLF